MTINLKNLKQKFFMDLADPRKRSAIRISINYRCVPGKQEPAFVRLAELQNPLPNWHGFRSITHNPEVSGSNPLPATIFQTSIPLNASFRGRKDRGDGRFWFKHALIY